MAINPNTQYPGKIATPDANYPYGGAQNISAPGDSTGTPWEKALVNDLFGMQQALLKSSGIVPSGAADKVGASQYLQSIVELASGRSVNYTVGGTANAITLTPSTGNEGPQSLFIGLSCIFRATFNSTGAVTANINGTGVKSVRKLKDGVPLVSGDIQIGDLYTIRWDGVNYIINNYLSNSDSGSWNPILTATSGSGGAITVTGSSYSRIGKIMTLHANIQVTNLGTLSGNVIIEGLPLFLGGDSLKYNSPAGPVMCGYVNFPAGYTQLTLISGTLNPPRLGFRFSGSGVNHKSLTIADLQSGGNSSFKFTWVYELV